MSTTRYPRISLYPRISFIVSVLDRHDFLNACLASLYVQDGPKEVLVACNSQNTGVIQACEMAAFQYDWRVFHTGLQGAKTCYESANMLAAQAKGEWLCFPSDDSLYVCKFSQVMIDAALRANADLVYCDCVYRKGETANPAWKDHAVLSTQPRTGKIDKTCFLVKRELFLQIGFPKHPRGWSDGALIDMLVSQGVRHTKAPGVLSVHQ